MRYLPIAQSAAIVMLGNFNPKIFHPSWFALNDLTPNEVAEAAEIALVADEYSEFVIGDFHIVVDLNRLSLTTKSEPFVGLSDFTTNLLALLSHTPIHQLGINYAIHFALENVAQRMALGRALAPTAPWRRWGESLQGADPKSAGGLRSLVMEESRPPRRDQGYRRVTIEPSVRQDLGVDPLVGLYLAVNDHCELGDAAKPTGALPALEWLAANFDTSLNESKEIVADLMEYAAGL